MPLFTSNSNSKLPETNYIKQWTFTLVLFAMLFSGLEFAMRSHGIKPTVIDNFNLWAIQRAKLDQPQTTNLIVNLGASRTNIGTDSKLFHALNQHDFVNLAVDGNKAFATLDDIADNTHFNGTILFSFAPNDIYSKAYHGQQTFVNFYQDHYQNSGAFEKSLNQNITTQIQNNSAVMSCPPATASQLLHAKDTELYHHTS